MSRESTTDRLEDELDVTDNGFSSVLDRIRRRAFDQADLIPLILRADQLAEDNFTRLLELRRALIALFGPEIGDNTNVVLQFLNEREEMVTLSI